jgi:hypothetical protein
VQVGTCLGFKNAAQLHYRLKLESPIGSTKRSVVSLVEKVAEHAAQNSFSPPFAVDFVTPDTNDPAIWPRARKRSPGLTSDH